MKRTVFFIPLLAAFLAASTTFGQMNLLSNGNFESKGKPKKPGQIGLAEGWSSPTDAKADFFSEKAKGDYSAPDNIYGREYTDESESYAGILLFSYKDKNPRSYLATELDYPLEEEEVYCIKFHVSLADLSKFACNNVGLYVSNQKLTGKQIMKYEVEPQITHTKNKIFQETTGWEAICRTYKAEGGEKFLYIGNFAKPDDLKTLKVKRPRGFTKPQVYNSYYYVSDVSIIPMDSLEECVCEKSGPKMNVVYSKSIADSLQMDDEQLVELVKVFFEFKVTTIIQNSYAKMDELVKLMNKNPGFKVEIKGHTGFQEQLKLDDDFSTKRAQVAKDYLVSKGIDSSRLTVKGIKDAELLTKDVSAEGRARNRRVEFAVVK